MPESNTYVETLDLRFRAPKKVASPWLPGGVWTWFILGLCLGVIGWLYGRWELLDRLAKQVSAGNSASASLFALEALQSLDASSLNHLVEGLYHPDPRVARSAHQKINLHMDQWGSSDVVVQYAVMKSLAVQLQKAPGNLPESNLRLMRSIAARLYSTSVSLDDPQVKPVVDICQRVLSGAQDVRLPEDSIVNQPPQVPPAPLPETINSATLVSTPEESQLPHRSSSSPVASLRLVASPTQPRAYETSAVESRNSFRLSDDPPSDDSQTATDGEVIASDPFGSVVAKRSTTQMPSSAKFSTTSEKPELPVIISTPASIASHPVAKLKVVSNQPDLAGIEKLQIAELIRLLAHENADVAKAAALGLRNQGMSDTKIQLASELAMGSAARRLELIQQVAISGDMDPRPWLVWMGEDGEPEVRKMAISLLIPMADENVNRSLRNLAARESDNQIKEMISRALISTSR